MSDNRDTDHGYDFEDFPSPGDGEVARSISGRTTRGLFAGMCLAAFIMAALLSKLFLQEVRGLPPGDIEDVVVDYADKWHEQMSGLKLDLFVAGIRDRVESWQGVSWNDVDCVIGDMVPSTSEFVDQVAPESSCPD